MDRVMAHDFPRRQPLIIHPDNVNHHVGQPF
jgi:hypothetical protein